MGQYVEWTTPPADADWDQFLVQRATSLGGTYSTIATVTAKDADGYWVTTYWDETGGTNHFYKIQPKNSVSGATGALTDAITQGTYTPTYTTPAKIASLMRVTQFGGDTRPTITEILEMIKRTEDAIDYQTGHAWRTRYSMSENGADAASPDYEYYDISLDHKVAAGLPIYLNHRSVKNIASVSGDALQVWSGSAYTDYLTAKTEGRASDWWLDNSEGILYLNDYYGTVQTRAVRIKYRYGEASVPGDIEELASKMVAIDLATSDDRSYMIPQGGSQMVLDAKVKKWQERVDAIIAARTELHMAGR
ncbi:MAG: hypothetical protein WC350_05525 [Candidatus Micrarchaeia archaeon]|jgi:hypothetical protein